MSGIDPNGGGALVVPGGGGTALPTASGAGELPVSDGAGSAYTATSAGDVVDAAIASVVGAVAGQAIVGDGAGDVATTSADVSAMLAAADAAAARAALGVTALPTASAAGELPVSDGAGTAYTATTIDEVVIDGMKLALTDSPAGTAVIATGDGDVDETSADVSAFLAAANAAAARTAIGAVPTSTLTTRGSLITRGAAAAQELALGAAGTRLRSDGTDPVWADPDVVCTFAELSTTYAPSAVLRGMVAYATDKLATYVCRRTAASTYAWRCVAYDRAMPGGASAQAWWKLEEAAGSTSFANSGAGGVVPLTATTSGSGAEVNAGTGSGPWGQPCVLLLPSAAPGGAYLESASGVIEPARPVTVALWVRFAPTFLNSDTFARFGKKYNAAFTSPTNALAVNVGAVFNASTVTVGGVATAGTSARGVVQGGWTHVGLTYDGVNQTAYLNGRARAVTPQTGAIDYGTGSGRTWYFGSSPVASSDRLNGQLSEIRVIGAAWTAAEMLEAYQRGVGCWDGGL